MRQYPRLPLTFAQAVGRCLFDVLLCADEDRESPLLDALRDLPSTFWVDGLKWPTSFLAHSFADRVRYWELRTSLLHAGADSPTPREYLDAMTASMAKGESISHIVLRDKSQAEDDLRSSPYFIIRHDMKRLVVPGTCPSDIRIIVPTGIKCNVVTVSPRTVIYMDGGREVLYRNSYFDDEVDAGMALYQSLLPHMQNHPFFKEVLPQVRQVLEYQGQIEELQRYDGLPQQISQLANQRDNLLQNMCQIASAHVTARRQEAFFAAMHCSQG